jgi:mRNA interferase RelE/StbE
MPYQIEIDSRAARQLRKLPREVQVSVAKVIDGLKENPRHHKVEHLSGAKNLYRVRAGDYRVVFTIRDDVLIVLVVAVGHRKEIYRMIQHLT